MESKHTVKLYCYIASCHNDNGTHVYHNLNTILLSINCDLTVNKCNFCAATANKIQQLVGTFK